VYQHLQRYGHYVPKDPRRVKPNSTDKSFYPPHQTEQKHDLEETDSDFCMPSPSSVRGAISVIKVVIALIGASTSFISVVVILNIAQSGSTDIAAALLAVHMGGTKLLGLALEFLKQRPL
jgi:hypothetical protein